MCREGEAAGEEIERAHFDEKRKYLRKEGKTKKCVEEVVMIYADMSSMMLIVRSTFYPVQRVCEQAERHHSEETDDEPMMLARKPHDLPEACAIGRDPSGTTNIDRGHSSIERTEIQ